MSLENIEILNGILMIIFCSISIVVGIRIIFIYLKKKDKIYIYAGLTWIFLVCPWYPGIISFIIILLGGKGLTLVSYSLIGNIFIPIALIIWMKFFTDLIFKEKQLNFIIISIIYGIIFYIFLFYFIFIDPNQLGELKGNIDFAVGFWINIFYIIVLVIILITGIIFAFSSLKSEISEYKLRGKLLLVAYICFILGAAIDALIPNDLLILIISRSFQIFSSLMFYLVFNMPNVLKKIIFKAKNKSI